METHELNHPSMMMRRLAGKKIISQAIATTIARMILVQDFGEAAARAQEPLTASADGDYWRVLGSKSNALALLARDRSVGLLNIKISQYDGQIVDLHYEDVS